MHICIFILILWVKILGVFLYYSNKLHFVNHINLHDQNRENLCIAFEFAFLMLNQYQYQSQL